MLGVYSPTLQKKDEIGADYDARDQPTQMRSRSRKLFQNTESQVLFRYVLCRPSIPAVGKKTLDFGVRNLDYSLANDRHRFIFVTHLNRPFMGQVEQHVNKVACRHALTTVARQSGLTDGFVIGVGIRHISMKHGGVNTSYFIEVAERLSSASTRN